VYAGKVVTAHETKINFNGWIGEGYISFDPTTGSGAYQIAGGENGGLLIIVGILFLLLGLMNPGIGVFLAVIGILFIG